ncbi:Uncharacterised protein [Clostridium paraputrificum]|uniref:hypothetical protein n=1 Tax=Clostridium paraputrificum TaxID=29363 RepID=UPI000D82CE95|nr:hypothetical protein [Clostridium paraputrificum]SQB99781.1 Uncharacterised protein [Clostridium paraputrificum]
MLNEDKSLKITTDEAIDLLGLLNKLSLKDILVNYIKTDSKLENSKSSEYRKLQNLLIDRIGDTEKYLALSDAEKSLMADKILEEHNDIAEKLNNIKEEKDTLDSEFGLDFVLRIPSAKKEVYRVLAKIFETDAKKIEEQDVAETAEMIKGIIQSPTFQGFFKLATNLKK